MRDYRMKRTDMHLEDLQVRVFNGRGWACPMQNSLTGFKEPNFATLHAFYEFRLDVIDTSSKITIHDDIPALWKDWVGKGDGTDPLGANFREGFKKVFVTQDEVWEPNGYSRKGIFNWRIDGHLTNISVKTFLVASHIDDKLIMQYTITNNCDSQKTLLLNPQHRTTREGTFDPLPESIDKVKLNEKVNMSIQCTISNIEDDKYKLELKPGETKEIFFGFNFKSGEYPKVDSEGKELKSEFDVTRNHTRERIEWFESRLPKFESKDKEIEKLYYQSMITMNECKWNRDDFLLEPFWTVGSWLFTIAWDTQFSAEAIALMNPESLREASWVPFTHGKMRKTWVDWRKDQTAEGMPIFYVQEPASVMRLITTYLKHTKKYDILTEVRDGKTLVEWLKEWAKVYLDYMNEDNLLDVEDDTEVIVEIRTDGYDHIVPNVNVLASEYLYTLSKFCKRIDDTDADKYEKIARDIMTAVETELWDEENKWFSNKYADGSKKNIYAYHLFDALGSSLLSYEKKMGLISHIKESEFLGKYGFYSISKQDTQHYDRIDADWGGGGQFAGMPGKIASNAFRLGAPYTGHEILKKVARWTNVFPYQPQNARAEQPFIDMSSMAIQVSSGASIEAIINGVFGIEMNEEEIVISPNYHEKLGTSKLDGIKMGGYTFDVHLYSDQYEVYEDGKMISQFHYGTKTKLNRKD